MAESNHILLTDRGHEPFLVQELRRSFPLFEHRVLGPGLVTSDFPWQPEMVSSLIFARQCWPRAIAQHAASISAWVDFLSERLSALPDQQPWQLHLVPRYGHHGAGQYRVELIRTTLRQRLQRKRRHLGRSLQAEAAVFTPAHSLAQLLLTSPDRAYFSLSAAPEPFAFRRIVSPFAAGEVSVAVDKGAPSRAFAKLLEAEARLGCRIRSGESCVDLGAAPGSWSYVALRRGASVLAIDRAPLRDDLMNHRNLVFKRGDAFSFEPPQPVDWLLCDVIAAPARTIELLLRWVRSRSCRQFVVTIKFKGTEEYGLLEQLKHALPPLCPEFYLTRLCANKNEVCAFGSLQPLVPLPNQTRSQTPS